MIACATCSIRSSAYHRLVDVGLVLAAHDDGVDALRPAVRVLDRDLRLPVGPQVGDGVSFRTSAIRRVSLCASAMGNGISSGVSVAGEADHHSLVAGAHRLQVLAVGVALLAYLERYVDSLCDVLGLLVDGHADAARPVVEAQARVDVPGVPDRAPHQLGDVDVGAVGADLAHYHDQPRCGAHLAGDAGGRVLGQQRVEDRVRDLVANLVGVTLCDGLGREQVLA